MAKLWTYNSIYFSAEKREKKKLKAEQEIKKSNKGGDRAKVKRQIATFWGTKITVSR